MRCDHTQWNTSPIWYGERRWEHHPNTMALSRGWTAALEQTRLASKGGVAAYALDETSLTRQGPRAPPKSTFHFTVQQVEPAEPNDVTQ